MSFLMGFLVLNFNKLKIILMKKILISTDFSENAQKAINYAVHLFEKEECTFFILHAYVIVPSDSGNKVDAKQKLEQIVHKLRDTSGTAKHIFIPLLETNTPLSAINTARIDKNVDYLFMGTKGSSALREIFIGSTAVSVIKHVDHCPIVAVPLEYEYDIPKEIVFASDFKKAIKPQELAPLLAIAKLWNSTLDIVHVKVEKVLTDVQKLNKQELRNNLKGIKHQFVEVRIKDSLSKTIQGVAKENNNVAMVAMLKNKHGFFEALVREAVLRNVAFKTEVPLLVLPEIG